MIALIVLAILVALLIWAGNTMASKANEEGDGGFGSAFLGIFCWIAAAGCGVAFLTVSIVKLIHHFHHVVH